MLLRADSFSGTAHGAAVGHQPALQSAQIRRSRKLARAVHREFKRPPREGLRDSSIQTLPEVTQKNKFVPQQCYRELCYLKSDTLSLEKLS